MSKSFFIILSCLSLLTNIAGAAFAAYAVQRFGGMRFLWFRMLHDGSSGLKKGRMEHLAQLPGTKKDIVFLGDSLTKQCEWHEILHYAHCKNRGLNGDKSDQVLKRLPQILASSPDKIFLMIGINDLVSREPELVFRNIRGIARQINECSPSTALFIQSILPVNNFVKDSGVDLEHIDRLNIMLQNYCRETNAEFIDLAPHFKDQNGWLRATLSHDGLHLNGKGYQLWANELKPYTEETFSDDD